MVSIGVFLGSGVAPCPQALRKSSGRLARGIKFQKISSLCESWRRAVEGTYDAVGALGALTVDTTSAAAGVVRAGVHGGCGCSGGNFVEQKARGAGEDRRKIVGRKRG